MRSVKERKIKTFGILTLLLSHLFFGGCGEEAPAMRFFTFGDWGTGDANQLAVANRAQAVCASRGCDFGLFLGDNFYTVGVSSVDDPQWQTKYEDVYGVHPSLRIPLYAILGNHDWDSPANPQAQVDFDLMDQDPFWRMPAFNYSFTYPPGASPLLEIFVINSNQFDDAAQTWLSDAIAASSATWKIVAFHHPIFNNGTTHPDDEKGIYSALRPIICGKADLLLSGHEHLFSHLRDSADGCGYDQLIVGTGGRDLYSSEADPRVLYTESNFGVGYFEVTAPALTFQFLRATGEEAYSFVWHK